MPAKESVDISTLTDEEIAGLLADFGLGAPTKTHKCYGGYSGSNYACTLEDGRRLLLKQTNDQAQEEVEAQVSALLYLKQAPRAPPTCYPWPRAEGAEGHRYINMTRGSPAIVLDFLDGRAANEVLVTMSKLEDGGAAGLKMFAGLGEGLGRLHSVGAGGTGEEGAAADAAAAPTEIPLSETGIRDVATDPKAACMVGMHGVYLKEFASLEPEALRAHPFVKLHAQSVPELTAAMSTAVPRGLLHGDPFLDNVLCQESGELAGFVDWEDVAIGPLLFDIGAMVIGCCYKCWGEEGDDNLLHVPRFKALLEGYSRVRKLTDLEKKSLLSFMHTALLCNATWRWRNFNVVHREVEKAKDAYRELADRLVALGEPANRALLQSIVDEA